MKTTNKLGDRFEGTYYGISFTGRLISFSGGKAWRCYYGFALDVPITLYGVERDGIAMTGEEFRANCRKIEDGPELTWDDVTSSQGHTYLNVSK